MKCAFCEMLNGRKTHERKEFPFLILRETKNTVSFLSIDFPAHEDGHTLVIPKKHYKSVSDVPKKVLDELIEHVSDVMKVVRMKHSGCNILLNDGKYADQSVFHVHFHVIPRDKGDAIKLHRWKTKKMTRERYLKLHEKMKRELNS